MRVRSVETTDVTDSRGYPASATSADKGRKVRQADRLGDDDRGAFLVFEAVMSAVLIFTAILFFTGVGRPTDAAEPGGIDLGQNAADILAILKSREFGDRPFNDVNATELGWGWVTRLVD